MRQRGCGNNGRIGNLHAVVHLVALFQSTQDGDSVFNTRLIYQHLLETSFQRRILFDVLAILIQRRGADAMQFPACQRRLQHIAGIHGTLGLAGTDHGMQFVDKQDDLPFLLGQIVEHTLEALFKFTAELGTGNQRAHVQ